MEEYVTHCEKAKQTGIKTDLPKILQSHLEEEQRGMQNQALAKVKTPSKMEDPKSTPDSPNWNTSTTTTTAIGKTDLQKEKELQMQEQKEEEKKRKQARRNLILWNFLRMKNPVRN